MPVGSATLLALGSAAARIAAKLWLRDTPAVAEGVVTVAAMLEHKLEDPFERARARREFERIAEDMAQRLSTYFAGEFGGLQDNELEAAALTLAALLERAEVTSEDLLAVDVDPTTLERAIRRDGAELIEHALLGDAASRLLDLALQESCNYIVEVYLSLAPFHGAMLRELLRRETELLGIVRLALDHLPAANRESLYEEPGERFRREYGRQVARRLDRLELFGVDGYLATRFTLSVAYITLSVTARSDGQDVSDKSAAPAPALPADDDASLGFVPADHAFRSERRVLLRGEAGSGKTTLLQWLAVNSARGTFTGALDEWNDTVPFFVQLRRYAERALPTPEDFVVGISPTIAGAMPDGWVHQQLRDGSALVLIDGVDELPQKRREEVRAWIEELYDTFPEARYVVTSRPPAASETWLDSAAFTHTELQPMTPSDTRAFIRHWHRALEAVSPDPEAAGEVARLRGDMQRLVREQGALRALATSPLLCALLCALHKERRTQLPRDRVQLYRIALEMLLERRDVERSAASDQLGLTLGEKQLLLEALAYSFNINRASDMQRGLAVGMLERQLRAMPHVRASAEEVFEHLLLRSGLLREPVAGRIDFVHRTFQDYLAARGALDQNHVTLLIERAHEDSWAETVILAAGLAQTIQREELISGVLKRGDREPAQRHRLHLLAAACLETSPRLSPEITADLQQRLAKVVPPRSMTEAKAVASAGELAAPLLSWRSAWRANACAAAVRALSLIGSDAALSVLATYAKDSRVTVARELIRAWPAFDPIVYAETVLAENVLDKGSAYADDPVVLPGLSLLARLRHLDLKVEGSTDLSALRDLAADIDLTLWGTGLADLTSLRGVEHIRSVRVTGCSELSSLTGLDATTLTSIDVAGCTALEDIGALEHAAQLEVAVLDGTALTDLAPLAANPSLRRLECSWCDELTDLAALADLPALRWLDLRGCRGDLDLRPVGALEALEVLWLEGCRDLQSLAGLRGLRRIGALQAKRCVSLTDLAGLDDVAVRALVASGCTGLRTLDGLGRPEALISIDLSQCLSLEQADALAGARDVLVWDLRLCRKLRAFPRLRSAGAATRVRLDGCGALTDLAGLDALPELRMLTASACTALTDVSALAGLPELRSLSLAHCPALTDLRPLAALPSLEHLSLTGCDPALDWTFLIAARPQMTIRPPGIATPFVRGGRPAP